MTTTVIGSAAWTVIRDGNQCAYARDLEVAFADGAVVHAGSCSLLNCAGV